MTKVSQIYCSQPVSEEATNALVAFADEIATAINKAKASGILQGFLVSTLHAHAHQETALMLASSES